MNVTGAYSMFDKWINHTNVELKYAIDCINSSFEGGLIIPMWN